MKKKCCVTVQGNNHLWSFDVVLDTKYLEEYRADGLEVYVIENSFPTWVADIGMVRVWCFFQDIINFKNPFRS